MPQNQFHFCIKVENSGLTQGLVKTLEKLYFITKVESLSAKEILVFLNLKSDEGLRNFLMEAELLKIEKVKVNRKTFQKEFVNKQKERFTKDYLNYISQRPNLPSEVLEVERFKLFKYEKRFSFLGKGESFESIFTPAEILIIENSLLGKAIQDFEVENKILNKDSIEVIALHCFKDNVPPKKLEDLKAYYGAHVALYFFFVSYMQYWLLGASVIGIMVQTANYFSEEDSDTSPFDSLYSFFMIIWASAFLCFWKKHENQLATKWRYENKKFFFAHKHNENELESKIDLVTGYNKLVVSPLQKFAMYSKSFLITLPVIIITILILVLSLNIRGYISPEYESIYIKDLSVLSDDGAIFDKNSYKANITTILHVIILNLINYYYSVLCEHLTEKEIHLTETSFNNSLVIKRFVFEIFNTFLDLSFIAYVKLDIKSLKSELLSLYTVDEFRRVIVETIIPLLVKKVKRIKDVSPLEQLSYNKYENFDDYLEIVINFAYLTLFASAFPLAPILTFIFHWIELKSDRFKINNCYQRPIPQRAKGIGAWFQVMNVVSIIAIYSNIILFSFSSFQIAEFFPWLFKHLDYIGGHFHPDIHAKIAKGMEKYLVIIVFLIEHFILIAIFFLRQVIKGREDWTAIYKDRRDYRSRIQKFDNKFFLEKYGKDDWNFEEFQKEHTDLDLKSKKVN